MSDARLPVAKAAYGEHPHAEVRRPSSLRAAAARFTAWREHGALRGWVVGLLAGPVLMAVMFPIGLETGLHLGFVAACVLVPIVTIALGVVLGQFTGGTIALLAVLLAGVTGLGAADRYDNIRMLAVGDFVTHVPIAELPRVATKPRVTLAGADERHDLAETAYEVHRAGGPSSRTTTTHECEAFPIVPEGWTPGTPVRVWRFGDFDWSPRDEHVFEPARPDALCRRAIAKATLAHHLTTARDAIYLEAKIGDSSDVADNQRDARFGLVFCAGLWMIVALYGGLRAATAYGWRRLRARARRRS